MAEISEMMREKTCACKGIRSCLLCDSVKRTTISSNNTKRVFFYCNLCGDKAWTSNDHSNHYGGSGITINGVFLATNVISENEEIEIVNHIDSPDSRSPWVDSQSGRRKQDYGPKVNFKKKICKLGRFTGIPKYAHKVFNEFQAKFKLLNNFLPVELCNLEYVPERGSAIDPHLDDEWLWGERLVTLNLLSTTVLTLTRIPSEIKYNEDVEIAITLPARSLLILYGDARHVWYHSIKRKDIVGRRLAMTWRELTTPFLPNGEQYESIGKELLEVAEREI